MTTESKPVPPIWSAAIHIMNRVLCKICGHFHPGGMFSRNPCACCRYDRNRNGWYGHS